MGQGVKRWRQVCVSALLLLCAACGDVPEAKRFSTHEKDYAHLPGWADDNHAEALDAFLTSCPLMAAREREPSSASKLGVKPALWRSLCEDGLHAKGNRAKAREFFERRFLPVEVEEGGKPQGLFTGYYVPLLHGSLKKQGDYIYPVYAPPPELATQKPYATRAEIEGGKLKGRGLEIVWVDDPVMLFFMHVQGSGRIRLTNGKDLYLGFAGKNEQPYVSLGKVVGDEGLLPKDKIDFFTLRQWLYDHPKQAAKIMQRNTSFVFFTPREHSGPIGAAGAVLTPGRSLAVDNAYIPYGLPLFLTTELPTPPHGAPEPFNRLMIAQDTGTAIRGAVRGDIFFGSGKKAEYFAGNMKGRGSYSLLIPRELRHGGR